MRKARCFSPIVFAATYMLALSMAAKDVHAQDGIPAEWAPWKDPNNPNVILLDPDGKDAFFTRRETSQDAQREPGLVNPQRYAGGYIFNGFPTFLVAPMAFNTEDLKAGKVDVALVGLTIDDQSMPGARFAANEMRTLMDGIEYKRLIIADYGNLEAHPNWHQRSLDEAYKGLSEILAADALPIAIGGTHVQAYAHMTALASKYGPKNFAVLHIDAHHDAYLSTFGRFVHNGNFFVQAVERGLVKGEDIIRVALRSQKPDDADLQWMRKNRLRSHFQAEITRDGWDKVLARVLEEVKGKKLYVTFDIDGVDPGYAPGIVIRYMEHNLGHTRGILWVMARDGQ